jgi:hypothetical protein
MNLQELTKEIARGEDSSRQFKADAQCRIAGVGDGGLCQLQWWNDLYRRR